jgi:transcriptional regulator with XRE-family HTH domain
VPWNPDALRRLRARRGLTQQQLADAAGAHRVTITNLETGGMQPGIDLLEALAQALRVKVTDLLTTQPQKDRRR